MAGRCSRHSHAAACRSQRRREIWKTCCAFSDIITPLPVCLPGKEENNHLTYKIMITQVNRNPAIFPEGVAFTFCASFRPSQQQVAAITYRSPVTGGADDPRQPQAAPHPRPTPAPPALLPGLYTWVNYITVGEFINTLRYIYEGFKHLFGLVRLSCSATAGRRCL